MLGVLAGSSPAGTPGPAQGSFQLGVPARSSPAGTPRSCTGVIPAGGAGQVKSCRDPPVLHRGHPSCGARVWGSEPVAGSTCRGPAHLEWFVDKETEVWTL